MKRIYKYPFEIHAIVQIAMPAEAAITLVACQRNTPCIWALVDPAAKEEHRRFYIFGTGHDIPDGLLCWGSFQQGEFVWHLFEKMKP
jgi:hypothetical protein